MKRKIAMCLGALFLLGAVVAPVAAQTLPGLTGAQAQGQEIELPDYSSWEVAQVIGYDTDLDGETNFYQKTLVRKVRLGPEEEALGLMEQLQLTGKLGEEPELVTWKAVEVTFEGPKGKFQRYIVKRDGKYYEVSPFIFQAVAKKFYESLPIYTK